MLAMQIANDIAGMRAALDEARVDLDAVDGDVDGEARPAVLDRCAEGGEDAAAAAANDAESEFFDENDAGTVATIKELLETRIRPAVANDGGDIAYRGFRDGVVYLTMQGACSGCPSSTATLKQGIEGLLKHYVPEVIEVRAA